MYLINENLWNKDNNLFLVSSEEKAKEIVKKLNNTLTDLKNFIRIKDVRNISLNDIYWTGKQKLIDDFKKDLSGYEKDYINDINTRSFSYQKINILE